jgi:hypothetical protein
MDDGVEQRRKCTTVLIDVNNLTTILPNYMTGSRNQTILSVRRPCQKHVKKHVIYQSQALNKTFNFTLVLCIEQLDVVL